MTQADPTEKRRRAKLVADDCHDVALECPHCGKVVRMKDCDILGADEGCLFCNQCGAEFEGP